MNNPLQRDPIAEARTQWIRGGWTQQADAMSAVTSTLRAAAIFLQRAEALVKPHGLSFARFEVLALLGFAKKHALPMSTASRLLQVHATSLTNSVDRLEAAGLLTRTQHPADRRTRMISLTPHGREVLEAARTALNAELFTHSGLEPDEAKALFEILSRLRRRNGDFL